MNSYRRHPESLDPAAEKTGECNARSAGPLVDRGQPEPEARGKISRGLAGSAPQNAEMPHRQSSEPCPRCGDPAGDCVSLALDGRMGGASFDGVDQDAFAGVMIACRLGQIALELKRMNDRLEGSNDPAMRYPR